MAQQFVRGHLVFFIIHIIVHLHEKSPLYLYLIIYSLQHKNWKTLEGGSQYALFHIILIQNKTLTQILLLFNFLCAPRSYIYCYASHTLIFIIFDINDLHLFIYKVKLMCGYCCLVDIKVLFISR